jgi:hypothetical protein
MLEITQLHDYQKKAVNYQCGKKNTALWLDMGTLIVVEFFIKDNSSNTIPWNGAGAPWSVK